MRHLKYLRLALLFAISFTITNQANAQRMGNQTVAMLSQSPAGSKIISFVKAVNAGEEITDDFVKQIMSDAMIEKNGLERLKNIMAVDIPENDGKLTVYVVERTARVKFSLYAKGSKSNEWVKMDFTFENASPYKMAGIAVDIIDEAPAAAKEPMKID